MGIIGYLENILNLLVDYTTTAQRARGGGST